MLLVLLLGSFRIDLLLASLLLALLGMELLRHRMELTHYRLKLRLSTLASSLVVRCLRLAPLAFVL